MRLHLEPVSPAAHLVLSPASATATLRTVVSFWQVILIAAVPSEQIATFLFHLPEIVGWPSSVKLFQRLVGRSYGRGRGWHKARLAGLRA